MVGLWVRSYYCNDHVGYFWNDGSYAHLNSGHGNIGLASTSCLIRLRMPGFTVGSAAAAALEQTRAEARRIANELETTFRDTKQDAMGAAPRKDTTSGRRADQFRPNGQSSIVRILWVPHWLILLGFAAYPTIAIIRGPVGRCRRRKRGSCLACGYDLTGNISGTCPECGQEVRA